MDHSAERRRDSVAASANFSLYAASGDRHRGVIPAPPPIDLELLYIKSSQAYTSLKDVLPAGGAAVSSPTAGARTPNGGYEITIRNRLVKQAAWAYLQPMSASPSYSGTDYFRRLRCQFSGGNPFAACLRWIASAVRWVLQVIGFSINR